MKAIILAAGRGSRMKQLTSNIPKCLVKLHGKELLSLQIESLLQADVTDIAIVAGYKKELLFPYSSTIFVNHKWESSNMVSSLECAGQWLTTSECIVSYSDIFYDSTAISSLINCTSEMAITYDPNWLPLWKKRFPNPLDDAETFLLDRSSFLSDIGKKPNSYNEIQGQYMGLLKFTPKSWNKVEGLRRKFKEPDSDVMSMTELLSQLITIGTKIRAIPYYGAWGEIDHESDLKCY